MHPHTFEVTRRPFSTLLRSVCSGCNSRYGTLEDAASKVFPMLRSGETPTVSDLLTLMGWLDKHRLVQHVHWMSRNFKGFENPHRSCVDDGIGEYDQMVLLVRSAAYPKALSTYGLDDVFHYLPLCISIIANGLGMVYYCGPGLLDDFVGPAFAAEGHRKATVRGDAVSRQSYPRIMLRRDLLPSKALAVGVRRHGRFQAGPNNAGWHEDARPSLLFESGGRWREACGARAILPAIPVIESHNEMGISLVRSMLELKRHSLKYLAKIDNGVISSRLQRRCDGWRTRAKSLTREEWLRFNVPEPGVIYGRNYCGAWDEQDP